MPNTTKLPIWTLLWLAAALSCPAQQVISAHGDSEFVHDPSLIKEGETWYLFSTTTGRKADGEIPVRCSQDLHEWKRCGNVFDHIPNWIEQESPGTKNLWAPDISFFAGEYHLYYAYSLFGKNTSGIALATNKTLDPHDAKFQWRIAASYYVRAQKMTSTQSIRMSWKMARAASGWGLAASGTGSKCGASIPQPARLQSPMPNCTRWLGASGLRTRLQIRPACRETGRRSKPRLSFPTANIFICLSHSICAVAALAAITKPWLDALAKLLGLTSTRTARPCSKEEEHPSY